MKIEDLKRSVKKERPISEDVDKHKRNVKDFCNKFDRK